MSEDESQENAPLPSAPAQPLLTLHPRSPEELARMKRQYAAGRKAVERAQRELEQAKRDDEQHDEQEKGAQ